MTHTGLNRREALRKLAAGGIGAATASFWVESLSALARAQAPHAHLAQAGHVPAGWTPSVLNAHQNETVVTLTELIIPQTDTPGAKAALVNRFIDSVLSEADTQARQGFLGGLAWIDARSTALFGGDFVSAGAEQQADLLTRVSDPNAAVEDKDGADFFQAIKSMTITGYYTTEIGLQQELGDDGQLFQLSFTGCTHPEHQS